MIGIINYRAGNLQNLQNSLDFLQVPSKILNQPEEMAGMEKFILPGVGAFGHAAKNLREYGFWQPLLDLAEKKVPLLGICVGMQLLFSRSFEDGQHQGLDLIPGEVRRFEHDLKIPQIGWNRVEFQDPQNPLVQGIATGSWFYFVHSYACHPAQEAHSLGRCSYGIDFSAIAHRDKIWGVQFHPEKSQDDGLALLKNFVDHC